MILTLSIAFQARSSDNFRTLVHGLVLCLGRPTVTNMARAASDRLTKDVTVLHRFFSRAKWSPDDVARVLLTTILLPLFVSAGTPLWFAADDTTAAKTGPKVSFAGWFRDAVRSTGNTTITHWAHNWVIVCLIVPCPLFPQRFLHLPVHARLYRKKDQCDKKHPFRTRHELLVEMMTQIAGWVGERRIDLLADGAYPSHDLVRDLPRSVILTSRIRRDATLFHLAPPRTGRPGRPAERGAALPKLEKIAKSATFEPAKVLRYGEVRDVLLHSFVALWSSVSKKPIRIVIVRDPKGVEHDDFFFTTDVDSKPADVVVRYAARWGVEEANREVKQSLGFDQVQSWSPSAVLRQAPFVLFVHSLVQAAYHKAAAPARTADPMPPPSFGRILTSLRLELWGHRITSTFARGADPRVFVELLKQSLATAA
jgi:hypothetical protein